MDARLLSVLLLLCPLAAAARPLNLRLPDGRPEPARLATAGPGLTINEALLKEYGYTLKEYGDLPEDERGRVEEWIRILEAEKRRTQAGVPSVEPTQPVQDASVKASLFRMRQEAEKNPDMTGYFDGSGGGSAPTPSVVISGSGLMDGGSLTPGGVRRFSLYGTGGLRLEGGTIGLDGSSPLVSPSPYLGLGKTKSGSNSFLDYDLKAQAYAVHLGARLYADDNPVMDARIDQGIASLRELDPALGIDSGDVDKMQGRVTYSSRVIRQPLFFGSALARIGRAYHLVTGADDKHWVDGGWSVMGLARVNGLFPNATTDQTVGARVNPGGGQHIGVFGGLTEALGLFDKTMVADSLAAEKFKKHLHPEAAPHAEIAAWGKVPYLSGAAYEVSAGRQWNPWTTLTSVSGSLQAPVRGVKVGAFGRYSDETGLDGDFAREKSTAGLTLTPKSGVDLFGQYQRDSAKFGDASIGSSSVLFGVKLTETGGRAKGSAVTMESLFGGREQLVDSDGQSDLALQLQQMLNILLFLKGATLNADGTVENGWAALQKSWDSLADKTRTTLIDAWAGILPNEPGLDVIMAAGGADKAKLDNLVGLLSDTKVLERVMVRAARTYILKRLESVDIPILGQTRMSAPMMFAAANAYALGLSPIPPVTAKDQQTVDDYLLAKIGGKLKCEPGTPDETTKCILDQLPPEAVKMLKQSYGDDLPMLLKSAIDWPSGILRREMNRLALQVMLGAEALNELAVDKGEKIADLNVRGLMKSFEKLDARGRQTEIAVYKGAAAGLQDELKAQDARLRARLTDYGATRLAWLQSQPAWPSNVKIAVKPEDWPVLLAVYGDAKIFDLILRCKAALAAAHPKGNGRLLIEVDRSPMLGSLVFSGGSVGVLGLPPRAVDLSLDGLKF